MEETVVQWEMSEMVQAFMQAPAYHLILEGFLIIWVLWLIRRKSYNPREAANLTEKEKEELISEWTPEPLVPDVDPDHPALHPRIVTGRIGKYTIVDGRRCLNVSTQNYLGMNDNKEIEDIAVTSLRKYGVGSCGPRGFYGTVDVHLELEKRLAEFMSSEQAILYSFGFSTIASAIPAYAKKGDVIFVDDAVNFSIQKGLQASRSQIKTFKHNDMDDLERLLDLQQKDDIKNPKKAKVTRRFLVVEGIYFNNGDICPLPKIVELKNKHKVRLFVDESVSFGVLGKTGKGVTEYFNIPTSEVDNISANLEYAIGSSGGFCCGTKYVVDHQVLSGLGYCFSASLPPMLAAAATATLDLLEKNPNVLEQLRSNACLMHSLLKEIPGTTVSGIAESPIKHVRLSPGSKDRAVDTAKLQEIVNKAFNHNVAFTVSSYLEQEELNLCPPSIRVTVNCQLTQEEIRHVVEVLAAACSDVL